MLHHKKRDAPYWCISLFVVEIIGLEPMTSCMSSKRSNQLSYTSEVVFIFLATCAAKSFWWR